jgi:NAD(P)-dependent dehydrogenase (short-subunit alcohol dehydrogenase family)
VVEADVSTAAGRDALLSAAINAHGRINFVVNNVGTNIRKASTEFTDVSEESRNAVDKICV